MYYQAIVAFETGVMDNEGNAKVKKFIKNINEHDKKLKKSKNDSRN